MGVSRTVTVEQSVDQMQIAGSATAGAHGKLTGQMRIRPRRERRDLLMANVQPGNPALPAQ